MAVRAYDSRTLHESDEVVDAEDEAQGASSEEPLRAFRGITVAEIEEMRRTLRKHLAPHSEMAFTEDEEQLLVTAIRSSLDRIEANLQRVESARRHALSRFG